MPGWMSTATPSAVSATSLSIPVAPSAHDCAKAGQRVLQVPLPRATAVGEADGQLGCRDAHGGGVQRWHPATVRASPWPGHRRAAAARPRRLWR